MPNVTLSYPAFAATVTLALIAGGVAVLAVEGFRRRAQTPPPSHTTSSDPDTQPLPADVTDLDSRRDRVGQTWHPSRGHPDTSGGMDTTRHTGRHRRGPA